MASDMGKLKREIERLRTELNVRAIGRKFGDPEILLLSQNLDELINKFYRLSLDQSSLNNSSGTSENAEVFLVNEDKKIVE